MRPVRIKARNFLGYADLDLDLSGIHEACVSGVNGAGKSNLVDALLFGWCLKARYKTLDEYVRLGATELSLVVEWRLGDTRYRVIRKRSTVGRGRTESELQLLQDDGDVVGIESGDAVTAHIARLNGMDYDTLVSSAICGQEDASRLTKATAGERMAILRSVFRLADYRRWQTLADARLIRLDERVAQIEDRAARLRTTVLQRDGIVTALRDATAQITLLTETGHRLQGALATLIEARGRMGAALARRDVERLAHRQHDERRRELQGRLDRLQTQIAAATTLVDSKPRVLRFQALAADLDRQIQDTTAEIAALEREQTRTSEAIRRARAAQVTISREGDDLMVRRDRWRATVDDAPAIRRAEEQSEILTARVSASKAAVERLRGDLAREQRQREEVRAVLRERETADRDVVSAQDEVTRTLTKSGMIDQVPCAGVERDGRPLGGTCPFLLDAWSAKGALPEMQDTVTDRAGRSAAISARLGAMPDEADLAAGIADLEHQIADRERSIAADETALATLRPQATLASTLEIADAELAAATAAIEDCRTRLSEQHALADQAKNEFDAATASHVKATRTVEALRRRTQQELPSDLASRVSSLQDAESTLPVYQEQAAALRTDLDAITDEADRREAALREFEGLDQKIEANAEATRRATDDLDKSRALLRDQELLKASAERTLAQIETDSAELVQIEADLDAEGTARRRWQTLAQAYRMVPILILENVIPAIEDEANAILGRIASRGLRVRFDSQKALKRKEELAETLDIVVRDQLGERKIEGYSGGERFRVDLAIRVAVAKVIARRSGVELKMLIIDEGFGALDAEGLSQVLEAIHRLKDDFDFIMVISHLDTVLEGFASRILVTHDAAGSHATVVA